MCNSYKMHWVGKEIYKSEFFSTIKIPVQRQLQRSSFRMESLSNFLLVSFLAIYEIYAKVILLFAKVFPGLAKGVVEGIAKLLFGVNFNGTDPTDVQVLKPEKIYGRFAAYLDLGIFEGYMAEEWTSKDLLGLCCKVFQSRNIKYMSHPVGILSSRLNLQTGKNAYEVCRVHYDIGNDLFEAILDDNLQYTCGYWRNATNLNEAQVDKMNLIAAKLQLKPGMRVLDLGCGFGKLGCHLAKIYGVSVVGCTISKEQLKYSKLDTEGLEVEIRLCDFRDMDEKFDRVLCVGLMEHVGPKNYKMLMKVAHRCLIDDGLFLIQTIGINHSTTPRTISSVNKYIFPNSQLPYYLEIAKAVEDLFIIEDWHNFGFDYSKTLAAWLENLENAWPKLKPKYGDEIYRMWKLYLVGAQALFITRASQLWQIVLSKDGLKGGYISVQ